MRRRTTTTLLGIATIAALAATALGLTPAPAGAEGSATPSTPAGSVAVGGRIVPRQLFSNPVTPGTFTGLGFDQCHAPAQSAMDAWLKASPYRAVGIYISGASRGCRDQPNLTPTWIGTQLAQGWRLLPITLGPQAACNPSFPRYGNDPVISTKLNQAGAYAKAFKQGAAEASTAVAAAQALGIVPGSTLWYDLEGYNVTNTSCRESSLWFLSAWTQQLHALGYVSGVYSSAGSGIKSLDDARVLRPGAFTLPDQIWIARWDGQANTSTSYIRPDGWVPGRRMKQFQGGHNEKWGGVTINIDRNYLDLGSGAPPTTPSASHCRGTQVDFTNYPRLKAPSKGKVPNPTQVAALKCLLKEHDVFHGRLKGAWTGRLTTSVKAWQARMGLGKTAMFSRTAWMTLLAAGPTPALNLGSTGEDVRRVQRALNAASPGTKLAVSGSYDTATQAAVLAWQAKHGIGESGVFGAASWAALQAGKR
jgi:Rv2525c-like, glycoside hydrolase-like domain/Putative peptidoglycan binding domain